jgi:sulfite exporter TauE/SafE
MPPSTTDLYAMFLLGIFGTGHCIGMCGPLVFAFPGRSGKWLPHLAYHGGRLLTYTAVGAFMGAIGSGLGWIAALAGGDPLLWIARFQLALSVVAAAFLLVFGLQRIGLIPEPRWLSLADPGRIPILGRLVGKPTAGDRSTGLFALGLTLGLLPCGLSFGAFARALAAGGIGAGAVTVLAFGIGTLPGLLLVGAGASSVARRYRKHSDVLSGILMILMALSIGADTLQALF